MATLQDIAVRLEISKQAVSQALRGQKNISPETRRRVKRVAKELGYRPNLLATTLRRQSISAVGFILPDLSYDYSQRILEGARSYLDQRGCLLMIGLSSWDKTREAREIELMLSYQVRGLVCQPIVEGAETYQRVARQGTRFTFVGNALEIPGVTWVGIDDYAASREVLDHLQSLGHRRIAMVAPESSRQSLALRQRIDAYEQVCRDADLPWVADYLQWTTLGESDSVAGAVNRLMTLPQPPTAILAISDAIGYLVLSEIHKRGLVIPRDVAIASFGDMQPSAFEMISLTSVRIDSFEIGRLAAQQVLEASLEPDQPLHKISVPTRLMVRRSTVG